MIVRLWIRFPGTLWLIENTYFHINTIHQYKCNSKGLTFLILCVNGCQNYVALRTTVVPSANFLLFSQGSSSFHLIKGNNSSWQKRCHFIGGSSLSNFEKKRLRNSLLQRLFVYIDQMFVGYISSSSIKSTSLKMCTT